MSNLNIIIHEFSQVGTRFFLKSNQSFINIFKYASNERGLWFCFEILQDISRTIIGYSNNFIHDSMF